MKNPVINLILLATFTLANLNFYPLKVTAQPSEEQKLKSQIALIMKNFKQSDKKWIEIDLKKQKLMAWEGDNLVYTVYVSTGKKDTPTPIGSFQIKGKMRYDRMKGPDYDLPKVPYVMYYDYQRGYAIHGADWHKKFGTPVSHGCTNVAVNHAKWLFNWATVGTPLVIRK